MQLLSSIPSLTFPDEWEALTISSSTPLKCLVSVNAAVVLDLTLRPYNGKIVLHDVGTLIRDRAEGRISEVKLEVVKEGNRTTLATSSVIPAQRRMGETATAFAASSFLSLLQTTKITHRAATERVAWIGNDSGVTVTTVWSTPKSILTRAESIAAQSTDGANIADVSPNRFTPPTAGAQLCRYIVSCGARRRHFIMAPPGLSLAGGVEIEYRNAFGIMDTMHAFGTVERSAKQTYKTARISGRTKNYQSEDEVQLSCTFAPLAPGDHSVEEVAISQEVRLLPSRAIIIPVESEIKESDDPTKIGLATVKFKVDEEAAVIDNTSTAARRKVFDDSFDNSYE